MVIKKRSRPAEGGSELKPSSSTQDTQKQKKRQAQKEGFLSPETAQKEQYEKAFPDLSKKIPYSEFLTVELKDIEGLEEIPPTLQSKFLELQEEGIALLTPE